MKEIIVTGEQNIIDIYVYALGWVNLSQKLEIEKNTVCGKVISSKKFVRNLFTLFLHKWHADLHGIANFCNLPVAHTF